MKFFNFLKAEQNTIGKATIVIVISVIFSKILGLIRDRLLASTFGANIELDIYFASFKVPDLIYGVVLAGGVLVSLLPLFSDYYKRNKEEAWKLINSIINVFSIILVIIAALLFIFTETVVKILLPELDPIFLNTAINLTRVLFVSVFFFGLSSIFSTVLNYFNRFLVYSIAPVLYALSVVLGIVFLSSTFGIYAPAIGVVVGSFLHCFIQLYVSLKFGYRYKFVLDFKAIKDFFKLLFPRTISAAVNQINLTIITIIAGTIAVGAITYFNLANNLRYLPIGLIGISFATAVFPSLSRSITNKNVTEFCANLRRVLQEILYFMLPVSILTFIMRDLVVNIVYGAGQFSGEAITVTSACLGIFALSLVFQCLEPTILRAFFSLKDSKTPAIISVIFLFVNLFLSLGAVYLLQTNEGLNAIMLNLFNLTNPDHALLLGLVLAYNISLILDFLLLFIFLRKKIKDFEIKKVKGFLAKVCFASIIMTIVALFIIRLFGEINGFWMSLIVFTIITIISFIVYFVLTCMLKTEETERIKEGIALGLNRLKLKNK